MIGIIGAMDIEIEGIASEMTEKSETVSGNLKFIKGLLEGKECVVAKCGAGKVNAAICAQKMISEFGADMIINTGVAGGIDSSLKVCSTVVANKVCQHDYDTTPLGEPLGYLSGLNTVYINCDRKIVEALSSTCEGEVLVGTVATGDSFICDNNVAAKIAEDFGACACEMEGGAIGQVCCCNNIPFGVLRTISDNGTDEANMSFEQFARIAADKASAHIKRAVKLL